MPNKPLTNLLHMSGNTGWPWFTVRAWNGSRGSGFRFQRFPLGRLSLCISLLSLNRRMVLVLLLAGLFVRIIPASRANHEYPPAQNRYMQAKIPGELIFSRIHAGPVFALARIQENIFEESFSAYEPNS